MTDLSIVAVIPLYNGAKWIEGAIRSIFSQTLQPDEIVVVDDGSTDGGAGAAIVERLAKERPITLLRKPNGGQSSARNFAVRHSSGALIALLDQDDIWYPGHLEELVGPYKDARNSRLGWTYSDFSDIDASGKLVSWSFISPVLENPKRNLTSLLAQGVIIQPSATLISRIAFEDVGGFDERLCGYEDDDLFLRIFRACYDNIYIPRPTSAWRIHATSCGASERSDESMRIYIQKLLHAFPDDPWRGHRYGRDIIAPRFINIWLMMYIRAARQQDYRKMREYAWEALKLVPLLGMKPRRFAYSLGLPLLQCPRLGTTMITMHRIARRILR